MEIIQTNEEYFKKINSLLEDGLKVYIASFGIYAGVLEDGRYTNEWGRDYRNEVGLLFDRLSEFDCDTTIKIGKPWKQECPLFDKTFIAKDSYGIDKEVGCSAKEKNRKWFGRYDHVVERWPKINFMLLNNSHVKLILIEGWHCIFGGRNLSDSNSHDLSFYSKDKTLFKKLKKVWKDLD